MIARVSDFYDENSGGSSRWGTIADARRLIKGGGYPLAMFEGQVFRHTTDHPVITLGGAGSGKFLQGIYAALSPAVKSILINDVGGQYADTTYDNNLAMGRDAFLINPAKIGVHGFSHPLNLLGILKNDEQLFANSRLVASMIVPDETPPGSVNAWVGETGSRWVLAPLRYFVLKNGAVTLAQLWEFITRFDSDDDYAQEIGVDASGMPYDVYSTMLEMFTKKQGDTREYGIVMGFIKDKLQWLGDPMMQEFLSGSRDYLADLANPKKRTAIYLVIPAEMTDTLQSFIRAVIGISMLYCQRSNQGGRALMYLDEVATCGGAAFIKAAVSKNRRFHDTHLVYQSYGQLEHHFGAAGAQEIMTSCGYQQFLGGGIGDTKTARMIEDILGRRTIRVGDPIGQAEQDYRAKTVLRDAVLFRKNWLDAAWEYRHHRNQRVEGSKRSRALMDAAEVMRLPVTEQILVPVALGVPAFRCQKLPKYWENPALAGKYGPDRMYSAADQVTVATRFGKRAKRFVTVRAPDKLMKQQWPQVTQTGEVSYVKGYRTW